MTTPSQEESVDSIDLYEEEEKAIALLENKKSGALSAFKRILKKDPDNVSAHFHLALIYLAKKQFEKALYHANRAREINPKEPNVYLNTGAIYKKMGNVDAAIKFYKKELTQNPDSPEVSFNLGNTYFQRRRWKTAAKYFERSFQLGHRVEELIVDLAVCYRKTGQTQEEINLYKNYLKLHPNDGWALENLGAALIDISDYQKALYYLMKAKKIWPNEPNIERNIKKALYGMQSVESKS